VKKHVAPVGEGFGVLRVDFERLFVAFDGLGEQDCLDAGGRFLGDGLTCDGDEDDDGVIGCDDLCPDAPAPGGVDADGRPLGDFDEDCDVDLFDFVIMQLNFTGP